jgi:hypothetical protein
MPSFEKKASLKYGDTLTGGGEGVIKSEGRSSMLWKII